MNLIDAHKCDTLEDLAKELDIDPETFKATVERYNELCESGEDTDFGKPSKYMKPIKQAPFWGLRKHIRVSSIDSGIMTNETAQALTADGTPFPRDRPAAEYHEHLDGLGERFEPDGRLRPDGFRTRVFSRCRRDGSSDC